MNLLSSPSTSRLLKIGLVANLLEWYEYSVYGYLAIVMGKSFLHDADPIVSLTKAWLLFAVSYLARPLGSIFWGYIGDRYGHAYSLSKSLLTMAIPTILIGMLPTYHHVGFVATAALIILRFVQGFAAGGELPISACYIFEQAPRKFRSILCSSVPVGVGLGLLSGSIATKLLYTFFTPDQILNGAWRIPYLFSIPLTFWILHIRSTIETSIPSRVAAVTHQGPAFKNVLNTFKQLIYAGFLKLVWLVGFMEFSCYVLLIWLPSYLTAFLGVSPGVAQTGNIFILATLQLSTLGMGYIASRIGYKRVLSLHTILIILLSYPLFVGLQTQSTIILIGIHVIFAILYSGLASVMMEALGNAYFKEIRASGMSITHNVGATFFGGTAPALCTWLINKTDILLLPAYLMIVMGVIALPIIYRLQPDKTIN